MNIRTTRLRWTLALLACLALPVLAAPAKKDQETLIAKVFTDGTLFGFAKECKLPEPELKKLYDVKFASSRDIALAKVPHYTPREYRRDFQSGMNTAAHFSRNAKPGSKAWRDNCTQVRGKVQEAIRAR